MDTDDYEIRIFRKEESIYEISEATRGVVFGKRGALLASKWHCRRSRTTRRARESKNALVALLATQSGRAAGWSSGAVALRSASNGQVLYRTFDALCSLICAGLKLSGSCN